MAINVVNKSVLSKIKVAERSDKFHVKGKAHDWSASDDSLDLHILRVYGSPSGARINVCRSLDSDDSDVFSILVPDKVLPDASEILRKGMVLKDSCFELYADNTGTMSRRLTDFRALSYDKLHYEENKDAVVFKARNHLLSKELDKLELQLKANSMSRSPVSRDASLSIDENGRYEDQYDIPF